MRIIGIDYGEKRIGIAVSDPLEITAQPFAALERKEEKTDIQELVKILKEFKDTRKIIFGLPKTLKGEIGISAQKTIKFIEDLKKEINIPVDVWDERLTTKSVERTLKEAGLRRKKRKGVIDKLSAAYMLQSYLDSIKHE